MMFKKTKPVIFIRGIIARYKEHEVASLGAHMTYYWILSFFPFLIFILSLFAFTPIANEEFLAYLASVLPVSMYDFIYGTVDHLILYRNETLLSVGAIGAIWTASAGVRILIRGINKAYGNKEDRSYWVVKPIAIVYTIIVALIIVSSFILLIIGNTLGSYLYVILGVSKFSKFTWHLIRVLAPVVPMYILFMIIYKYIPKKEERCQVVSPGAAFATLSLYFFSSLFSIYVDNFGRFNQMYGSVGGIFFLFTWLYVSSLVILLGAEVNGQYREMICVQNNQKKGCSTIL